MTDLKQAAQQALEALVTCCAEEWRTLNNFGMRQVYDEKKVNAAIVALHAALLADVTPAQMAHADAVAEPKQIGYARCPRCWEPITAPTSRKPLTDEELRGCWDQVGNNETVWAMRVQFARAIERAHGIGEQT